MRLLSWNIHFQVLDRNLQHVLGAIRDTHADILNLQEVPARLADTVRQGLVEMGLGYVHDSAERSPPGNGKKKLYQNFIASRFPLETTGDRWRAAAPFPELLARVIVKTPEGPLEVFNAHIPNGSGNGWKKIDTFNVLSAALRAAPDAPRILTGDFNEPFEFRSSGQIVPFGERLVEGGGIRAPKTKTSLKAKETRPGIEWPRGVRSVLSGQSEHGLRDVYRALHGWALCPVTHYTASSPRCFDHFFASRHVEVESCVYQHEWREKGWSDHSALVAELNIVEVGALVSWQAGEGSTAP